MIKAIETSYDGYLFRSRTEARWAFFFRSLSVRYEYEPNAFDLDGLHYLPDFWLPEHKYWVEIKGEAPDGRELKKAELLRDATTYPVFIFTGSPGIDTPNRYFVYDIKDSGGGASEWEDARWFICLSCGKTDLAMGDETHQIVRTDWEPAPYCQCNGTGKPHFQHPRLMRAFEKARSARFEKRSNPRW